MHICLTHATPLCTSLQCSCCPSDGAPALPTGPKIRTSNRVAVRGLPDTDIRLTVKRSGKAPLALLTNHRRTIWDLKLLIEARTGIAPHQQQLMIGDYVLTNEDTLLHNYGLVGGDTLFLYVQNSALLDPPRSALTLSTGLGDKEWLYPTLYALARIAAFQQELPNKTYEGLIYRVVSQLHDKPLTIAESLPLPSMLNEFGVKAFESVFPREGDGMRRFSESSYSIARWILEQLDPSAAAGGILGSTISSQHPWTSMFQWKKQVTVVDKSSVTNTYKRESVRFTLEPRHLKLSDADYAAPGPVRVNSLLLKDDCTILPFGADVGPSDIAPFGYRAPTPALRFFDQQRFIIMEQLTATMEYIMTIPPVVIPNVADPMPLPPISDHLQDVFETIVGQPGLTLDEIFAMLREQPGMGVRPFLVRMARYIRREIERQEEDFSSRSLEKVMREIVNQTARRLIGFAQYSVLLEAPKIAIISLEPESTKFGDKGEISVDLDEILTIPRATGDPRLGNRNYTLFAVIGKDTSGALTYTIDSVGRWYVIRNTTSRVVARREPHTVTLYSRTHDPVVLWYAEITDPR